MARTTQRTPKTGVSPQKYTMSPCQVCSASQCESLLLPLSAFANGEKNIRYFSLHTCPAVHHTALPCLADGSDPRAYALHAWPWLWTCHFGAAVGEIWTQVGVSDLGADIYAVHYGSGVFTVICEFFGVQAFCGVDWRRRLRHCRTFACQDLARATREENSPSHELTWCTFL